MLAAHKKCAQEKQLKECSDLPFCSPYTVVATLLQQKNYFYRNFFVILRNTFSTFRIFCSFFLVTNIHINSLKANKIQQ